MSRYIKYQGKLVKFADKLLKMAEWVYNEGVYYLRVLAGGGTVANRGLVEDLYKLWDEQGRLDDIKVAILPQAGSVQRTSGIYRFFSKLFTLRTDANDVTQTTANSQPYFVNGAMVNPNGASRFMTHPTVSFGAGDAWSVSVMLDITAGSSTTDAFGIVGSTGTTNSGIACLFSGGTLYFWGGGSIVSFIVKRIWGKNKLITFVADGLGNISLYIDGVFSETKTTNTAVTFNNVLRGYSGRSSYGNIKYYLLESGNPTPTQILEEYNLLRSYIPEIATTLIGTDEIATENCQMVATPMGRVITLQNTPATWATASTIYANTYAATSGTVAQKTSAALLAAAMWRSPDSDHDKQAVFGKLFNGYAAQLLQMDIDAYNAANPSTPWGYDILTEADEAELGDDASALKIEGTDYWTLGGGTNETGFTALPAGIILADGTYTGFGKIAAFWTKDSPNDPRLGASIRLKKV